MVKQVNPILFYFFSLIPSYAELFLGHKELECLPEPALTETWETSSWIPEVTPGKKEMTSVFYTDPILSIMGTAVKHRGKMFTLESPSQ